MYYEYNEYPIFYICIKYTRIIESVNSLVLYLNKRIKNLYI